MKYRLSLTKQDKRDNRALRLWLYSVFAMLLLLIAVGGITRLTNAGLSITEWQPLHGIIPPLTQQAWLDEFAQYQQIAQYKLMNAGMTLSDFKSLFWWEWSHRLIARLVGFLVLLPLLYFWATGRINPMVKRYSLVILGLGALQGFIGWWMVSSGVGESSLISVSQYRLAAHLTLAALIIFLVLSLAQRLTHYQHHFAPRSVQTVFGWLVLLIFIQIYLGAIVAGLHAGLIDNSWPLVEGSLIPPDLFPTQPWWKALFQDPRTAQFIHRAFAMVVVAYTGFVVFWTAQVAPASLHSRHAWYLLLLALLQATIGIIALLKVVPLPWALAHQIMAFIFLSAATIFWRQTKAMDPKFLKK